MQEFLYEYRYFPTERWGEVVVIRDKYEDLRIFMSLFYEIP